MENPQSVGIILDGNRRFAKRLMLKPWEGHKLGANKIRNLLKWCKDTGVKELTLFTFSLDNFDRPSKEFNYLMTLFEREFKDILADPQLYKEQIKIDFIGKINLFPQGVIDSMKSLMEKTKDHKGIMVHFAMAYGGRAEIVDAARTIVSDVQAGKLQPQEINEALFEHYLYMRTTPDMIIRTGGEKRTSGFLLWQGEYSELFFVDKLWPEFEKEDFLKCIEEYKTRERRFGR